MNSSKKLSAFLLICMLFISTSTPILGCGYCDEGPIPKHKPTKPSKGGHSKPIRPITTPPVTVPVAPGVEPPKSPGGRKSTCPPPPPAGQPTCPIDALKLGACVDLLGGLIHIGLGPVVNQCCPILQGLVEIEAAVCLCTTLKLKLLNLNLYVPLALQLLLTCGKAPPPGFTCSI